MAGSVIAAGEIFQPDITELGCADVRINEHDRDMETGNGIKEFIFEDSGKKQTVHVPVLQKGYQFFGGLNGAEHEVIAIFAERHLDRTDC